MKLYIFDHCPYCLKARMVARYKRIALTELYLPNHDVATPTALVGKKVVPILQFDDGKAMAESMDIAALFDKEHKSPVITQAVHQAQWEHWFEQAKDLINLLVMPRFVQMPLPEYEQPAAIHYFTEKKQSLLGMTFSEALANSQRYIAQLEALWPQLPALNDSTELSWDDVNMYPFLRNLTCVAGLNWPEPIRNYVEHIAELTQTSLYFSLQR